MTSAASTDTIARLRVRAASGSADRARVRIAHMVAAGDLRPPGVPPAATLVVRALADPLPGAMRVDGPLASNPTRWHAALRDAMATTWAQARRPAREAVGADAAAVRFDDQAELLACLARDLGACGLDAWWWALLLPRRPGGDAVAVAQRWYETPHAVPAALVRLASSGKVRGFAARLPAPHARAIAQRVTEAHGLAAPAAAMLDDEPAFGAADAGPRPADDVATAWAPWAPEATLDLGPERAVLLAVGLTLARRRAAAAQPVFARAIARALELQTEAPAPDPPRDDAPPAQRPTRPLRRVRDATPATPTDHRTAARRPGHAPEPPPPSPAAAPDDGEARAATAPDAADAAAPTRGFTALNPTRDAPTAAGIATAYASTLFLLNVALALELYGDFTRPLHRAIELDPWDLVALLGAALSPGLRDDPLWDVLAALAGRDDSEEPGRNFAPRAQWRPAPEWMIGFGRPQPPRAIFGHATMTLEHPAGFALLHTPERPLDAHAWVHELARYVRARLAVALGDGDPGAVLHVAGEVHVAAERVDVVMALDDLPIRARAAGLDRDPGWVPAAGRDVAFHFHA